MSKRLEIEWSRPGVVHQDPGVFLARHRSHRRNVEHLECLRAGAFQEYDRRVRPHELGDVLADDGIEIGRLDAETLQHRVAKPSCRSIDGIADKDVVAGVGEGQHGRRDRREAIGGEQRACAILEAGYDLLQRLRRRCAAPPVGVLLLALLEALERFEQDGRAPIDGRVDEPVVGEGIAT
jgi:hypothetical protein